MFDWHFCCLSSWFIISSYQFLAGTCFKVSDGCVLSAIVCLQMIFVTYKICVSYNIDSILVVVVGGGGVGAMCACLFLSHQEKPAEAVLHICIWGVVQHLAATLCCLSKHFKFSIFMKILFHFAVFLFLFWSAWGHVCPICFRFPQETLSASFVLYFLSSLLCFHRHRLAGSSVSMSLLCGHFRRGCVSHECFFQSIHINRDSLSVHTRCPTHIFSSAPVGTQPQRCVNPSVRLSPSCIVSFEHREGLCADYVLTDYPVQWNRLIIELPNPA